MALASFKAYDIRGRIPFELNEDLARNIGRAYVERFGARRVVVGRDMRLSSPAIAGALSDGLREGGADVIDIGLGGTELVYFATFFLEKEGVDGGIAVTASHNPADYNGMKLVTKGSVPISGDSGLKDIERLAEKGYTPAMGKGAREEVDVWSDYTAHLLSYVDVPTLARSKVVMNAGNGCAGIACDRILPHLPAVTATRVQFEPDGTFPNGVPNPLLEENRPATANVVREMQAQVGFAWDGDHDRCFFFDENGAFVEGYYMVGLFADELLRAAGTEKGASIVHDPRLVWNTVDLVEKAGGRAVMSKTGHAFIKERMRKENSVYGGEMSAHHYFRAFAYCDSGMIPWLLLLQTMSRTKKSLAQLVADMQARFPASGEINLKLADAKAALAKLREKFGAGAQLDETDGVSLDHGTWRVNVRSSNTEPVVRVNVESKGDPALMRAKTDEVLAVLKSA